MINTREEDIIQAERQWSETLWKLFEQRDFDGAVSLIKEHHLNPVSDSFHNDLKSDVLFWGLKNKIESPWLWALFLEVTEQPHRIFDVLHTSLQTQQSFICQEPLFSHLFAQFSPQRQKQLLQSAQPAELNVLWNNLNEEQQSDLWATGFFTAHGPSVFDSFLKSYPFKTVDAYLSILRESNDTRHSEWKQALFSNTAFQGFWDQFMQTEYSSLLERSLRNQDIQFFERLLDESPRPLSLTECLHYLKAWLNKQHEEKEDFGTRPQFGKEKKSFQFPYDQHQKLCAILAKKMNPDDQQELQNYFSKSPLIKFFTPVYLPYKYTDLTKYLAVGLQAIKPNPARKPLQSFS